MRANDVATGKIRSSLVGWPTTKSVQEVFLTMLWMWPESVQEVFLAMLWDVGESAQLKTALVGIVTSLI